MYSWLTNQIGSGATNLIAALVVLIVVIGLVFLALKVIRRLRLESSIVGKQSLTPRLSVCDAAAVDHSRRLVLVRRDNVEHLILIGGPSDLVIETNIGARPLAERKSPLAEHEGVPHNLRPVIAGERLHANGLDGPNLRHSMAPVDAPHTISHLREPSAHVEPAIPRLREPVARPRYVAPRSPDGDLSSVAANESPALKPKNVDQGAQTRLRAEPKIDVDRYDKFAVNDSEFDELFGDAVNALTENQRVKN